MKRIAFLVLVAAVGCSSRPQEAATSTSSAVTTADPLSMRLSQSLSDLASFGNKRAGTTEDVHAGNYLKRRFQDAGLEQVHFEEFTFPKFELSSSSVSLSLGGVASATSATSHEVLAYSGTGTVDADIAYVGKGHPADYVGKDVRGKLVLVDRDARFHRATQLTLVAQNGGVGMIWASTAPNDLIQVGTVSLSEGILGAVPAVSIAATPAQAIRDAIAAGQNAHGAVSVDAAIRSAGGRNLVGTLRGSDASGAYLVVGAHYDTWFTGSYDNSAGVAAVLAMAEDLAAHGGRKLTLRFVAYDAEEVGLFGGYDYLRKHVVAANEPLLGFVNLETPANDNDGTKALAHTNGSPFPTALTDQGFPTVYPSYIGMEVLQPLFGGVIPTDIQGMYRYGLQGTTTFSDSPYYHTTADTPDKVNIDLLTSSVTHFESVLNELDNATPASFEVHDPTLWKPAITTSLSSDGTELVVNVVARDAGGTAQPAAAVEAWVDQDDFTRVAHQAVTADANGAATLTLTLPASVCSGPSSWLHVTTGKTFPLSESISQVQHH
jgi:aminopeptidase YwaD